MQVRKPEVMAVVVVRGSKKATSHYAQLGVALRAKESSPSE